MPSSTERSIVEDVERREPESVILTDDARPDDGYGHYVLLSIGERDLLVRLALKALTDA